jgi:sarcosine oxidase subunit delta
MQIRCPWCGPRELEEFRFRSVLADEAAEPVGRLYDRADTGDTSVEYWQHEHGCRAWLIVTRDPSTARVLDVRPLAATGAAT